MPFDIPILVFTIIKQINKYFKFSLYAKYVVKICVVEGTCSHTTTIFKRFKMSNISDIQSLMKFLLTGNYIRNVCCLFRTALKQMQKVLMSPRTSKFAWSNWIHSVGLVPVRLSLRALFTTKHTANQPNSG